MTPPLMNISFVGTTTTTSADSTDDGGPEATAVAGTSMTITTMDHTNIIRPQSYPPTSSSVSPTSSTYSAQPSPMKAIEKTNARTRTTVTAAKLSSEESPYSPVSPLSPLSNHERYDRHNNNNNNDGDDARSPSVGRSPSSPSSSSPSLSPSPTSPISPLGFSTPSSFSNDNHSTLEQHNMTPVVWRGDGGGGVIRGDGTNDRRDDSRVCSPPPLHRRLGRTQEEQELDEQSKEGGEEKEGDVGNVTVRAVAGETVAVSADVKTTTKSHRQSTGAAAAAPATKSQPFFVMDWLDDLAPKDSTAAIQLAELLQTPTKQQPTNSSGSSNKHRNYLHRKQHQQEQPSPILRFLSQFRPSRGGGGSSTNDNNNDSGGGFGWGGFLSPNSSSSSSPPNQMEQQRATSAPTLRLTGEDGRDQNNHRNDNDGDDDDSITVRSSPSSVLLNNDHHDHHLPSTPKSSNKRRSLSNRRRRRRRHLVRRQDLSFRSSVLTAIDNDDNNDNNNDDPMSRLARDNDDVVDNYDDDDDCDDYDEYHFYEDTELPELPLPTKLENQLNLATTGLSSSSSTSTAGAMGASSTTSLQSARPTAGLAARLTDSAFDTETMNGIGRTQQQESKEEDEAASAEAMELQRRHRNHLARRKHRQKNPCIVRRSLELAQAWNMKGLQKAREASENGSTRSWEDALGAWNNSLEIVTALLGKRHVQYAMVMNNRGIALGRLGRFDEAFDALNVALEIRQARLLVPTPASQNGPSHPSNKSSPNNSSTFDEVISTLHNLANVYQAQGDLSTALRVLGYSRSLCCESIDKFNPFSPQSGVSVATCHLQSARLCVAMGHVYWEASQFDDAHDAYQDALKVYEHLVTEPTRRNVTLYKKDEDNNRSTPGITSNSMSTSNNESQLHHEVVIAEISSLRIDIQDLEGLREQQRCNQEERTNQQKHRQRPMDGQGPVSSMEIPNHRNASRLHYNQDQHVSQVVSR